jgi:hypothetical protein
MLQDQFDFRHTVPITATVITFLDHVTHLLADNPYVAVKALDFSKAFYTVRHTTLANKLADLSIPDYACN